ncbi:hypothetical protein [Streptomyces sp. NPDC052015]|uniref:hypothetical protein n=1 Tax=Streptomyces sp. NPDC052015 TaxID=3154755 RepID=UPI003443E80E
MAAESYPALAGGQRITATLLRSMLPQTVRKTADTQRTATTAIVADDHLILPVEANAVYTAEGWIKYSGAAAADLGIQWTVPSGAVGEWSAHGVGTTVIGSNTTPTLLVDTQDARGYMIRTEPNELGVARTYGCISASATLTLFMYGTIRMGSTAGNFSIDWAQSSSNATPTTLYTDSWLRVQRIQ